jgi:cytochrome b561
MNQMHVDAVRSDYGPVTQLFHWATAILVVAAYFLGPGGREHRAFSPYMATTRELHETLGIAVLVIVLLRIVWRLFEGKVEHPDMAGWISYSSKSFHLLLYALLLSIPATAIAGTWLQGHPLTLLIGEFGPFLRETHDLGTSVMEIHTTLGDLILWMAGLHAAVAIGHHFVLCDRVLVSMLPEWLIQPPSASRSKSGR